MRAIAILLVLMAAGLAAEVEWVNLWPGEAPGAKRPAEGSETVRNKTWFMNIEVPQYALYKPEKPSGTAVVVCPGGGYGGLAMAHEGHEVGAWFAQRGVTAMVVKYRVGKADFGYQFPVPLLDVRRAIRTVRARAADWGVDPKKVGVMGFSAGGHLASMATTMFGEMLASEPADAVDKLDCRPDFSILCYPVIAMGEPYCHLGSVRNLLGENPPQELLDRCNTAQRVSRETPPVFLVHSADDGVVPLRNATEFAARCAEEKIPVSAAIYSEGGHGYGLTGRGDSAGWTERLEKWMQGRGF